MPNPYAIADARQEKARWHLASWLERLSPLLPLLGALAALPLMRDSLYHFLDTPQLYSVGLRELLLRLSLVLAASLCLSTFSVLIRGPDRGLIDLHPLRAEDWLKAKLWLLTKSRLYWLGIAWMILLPLWDRPTVLFASALLLTGAWVAGMGLGIGVNLVAPGLAEQPAWAMILDGIRGYNPRMQAALIWAPGVALAGAGVSVVLAVVGLQVWIDGQPVGILALILPFLAGMVGLVLAWSGRANFARIPAILGEVDAAWSQLEDPAEERRVYLDWMLRGVPTALRLPLQKDLRQGWREWRGMISGSWGLALLSALSGWTIDRGGYSRVVLVATAGAALVGSLGVWMQEPAWLRISLPVSEGRRFLSRALALWAWAQPVLLAGSATLIIRQGNWSILPNLEARTVLIAVTGALCNRAGTRGFLVYVPMVLGITVF